MPNWIRFPLVLAIIGIISAASLAGLYKVTDKKKRAIENEEKKQALSWVIPGAQDFVEVNAKHKYYEAKNELGEVVGYAIEASAEGYAGPVSVITGVDTSFKVIGTKVLSHNETPGLGDKVEQVNSKKTWGTVITGTSPDESKLRPYFQVQFIDKEPPLKLKRNGGTVEAITGATISSRAVVNAVNMGVAELRSELEN